MEHESFGAEEEGKWVYHQKLNYVEYQREPVVLLDQNSLKMSQRHQKGDHVNCTLYATCDFIQSHEVDEIKPYHEKVYYNNRYFNFVDYKIYKK